MHKIGPGSGDVKPTCHLRFFGLSGIVIGVRKGNDNYTKAWGDFDVEAHVPEHTSTIHQMEWKYIDGLSVAEIAQRLGVATKAAESLLTRARDAFRDAFRSLYGGSWSGVEES